MTYKSRRSLPNAFPGIQATINVMPTPFPGMNSGMNPSFTTKTNFTTQKNLPKGIKAGTNGTIVAVIMDESGSMSNVTDATIDGFNEFVAGQKADKDKTSIMVNKFEGDKVINLWGIKDVNDTPPMSKELYCPCGMTNLYDAIGQTIIEIDDYLRDIKKKNRPAVIIMIMTDGHENSSRTYSNNDIKQLVSLREDKNWVFQFFGANIDAFAVGSSFGMSANNTMQYSTNNMGDTMAVATAATSRMKMSLTAGATTRELYSNDLYTPTERGRTVGGNK